MCDRERALETTSSDLKQDQRDFDDVSVDLGLVPFAFG
jgi:hypothetical protein